MLKLKFLVGTTVVTSFVMCSISVASLFLPHSINVKIDNYTLIPEKTILGTMPSLESFNAAILTYPVYRGNFFTIGERDEFVNEGNNLIKMAPPNK